MRLETCLLSPGSCPQKPKTGLFEAILVQAFFRSKVDDCVPHTQHVNLRIVRNVSAQGNQGLFDRRELGRFRKGGAARRSQTPAWYAVCFSTKSDFSQHFLSWYVVVVSTKSTFSQHYMYLQAIRVVVVSTIFTSRHFINL